MTTTPESWEQQLRDPAHAIPDTTLSTLDRLRERIAEALNSAFESSGNSDLDAHRRHSAHQYSGWCYVCQGDTAKLANAVMRVVGPELKRRDAAHRNDLVRHINVTQSLTTELAREQDRADDVARKYDEARLKLTRFESMFGDVNTARARLDGLEAIAAELREELGDLRHNLAQRAYCAPDTDDATMLDQLDKRVRDLVRERDNARAERDEAHGSADEYYALAETAATQRAALWHLLRKQTRQMRIWRRRANTAITEAVEQTARDMQRAGQLRRELNEARARIDKARDLLDKGHPIDAYLALSEPATDTTPGWTFTVEEIDLTTPTNPTTEES